jgi:hypothetical protein
MGKGLAQKYEASESLQGFKLLLEAFFIAQE